VPSIRQDPPSEFVEPLDGYWPLWLLASLIAGGVTWYYSSFFTGGLTALGLFVIGGILIHLAGVNIFGGERRLIEDRSTTYYSCLRCKQPVKETPGAA
jgi:hypothetical protein